MAILDLITAFSTSGVLGGITGLIGNELKARREIKMMKIQGELEQASWPERQKVRDHEAAIKGNENAHEIRLHEINMKADKEEHEQAIIAAEVQNSGAGLVVALESDKTPAAAAAPEFRWVGAVRSMVRPVVCFMLIILTGVVFAFSPVEVRAQIVAALLYLTTLAVSFYYGDRPSSAMKKMLIGGGV